MCVWQSTLNFSSLLLPYPCMKLRLAGTIKRLNVEHRTSNIEPPILMALRFIYFKTSKTQNTDPQNFERLYSLAQRRRLRRVLLNLFLKVTEYIIRCWTFNVQCSMFIFKLTLCIKLTEGKVSFSIKLAAAAARDWAEP